MKKWMAWALVFLLTFSCCAYAGQDELASAHTTLRGSSSNKIHNITLACDQLDGYTVDPGDSFSFNEVVGPRTSSKGYRSAMNGRGSNVIGGGVSQLATTLYLALLDSGLVRFTEVETYGSKFEDNYVSDGDLAVITDYSNDHDFCFVNRSKKTLCINAWVSGKRLYVSVTEDAGGGGKGWEEELSRASTTLAGSSANKIANIELACDAINAITIAPGEWFSFNETVGKRSTARGYRKAINGRGSTVVGGGVSQVATTIYLALKDTGLVRFDEFMTYGSEFTDNYVSNPAYAIVTDYANDHDLSFTNRSSMILTIYLGISNNKLTCVIVQG